MKRKFLWLAAGIFLVLAAGELTARIGLGLGNPPLSQAHPRIEYLFIPNQDVQRFGNRVLINAYGMRSPNFNPDKTADELRILVFGDSVLNGGNLTDQAELATSLLIDRLADVHKGQVTVGNVSAGSWGPGNWLEYAREYGFFNADAVILVASSHDIADNPKYETLDPDTHPEKPPIPALVEGLTRYLPRYLPKFGQNNRGASKVDPAAEEHTQAITVARGREDLRAFLEMARETVPVVLVVQHPSRSELRDGDDPGRRLIADIAAAAGVTVYPLNPALESAIDQSLDPYRDNIHINAIGQQALAKVLFASLVEALSR